MGSSHMLGPEHPLSRADSRMRTLRAQFAVTVVLGLAMLASSPLLGASALHLAAGAGAVSGLLVVGILFARASQREQALELIASGREELPLPVVESERTPPERPPLPPPAGANARRDPCRSHAEGVVVAHLRRPRGGGGRAATSCTEVARLLRELPNVRARGVALVTQADPRRRDLTALPRARPAAARGARPHPARAHRALDATRPRGAASGPRPRLAGCPRRSRSLRAAPTRCAGWPAALGLQRVTAEVLVRRGLTDPDAARAFLESDGPLHDPFALGDVAEACALIESAIAAGRPIVVHGDYDVDGVCATALAVEVLRLLGGEVEPFLPSRFEQGYGVAVGDRRGAGRRRHRAADHRRLRHHRARGRRARPRARARRRGHRPPPARETCCRTRRSWPRARPPGRPIRSPTCAAPGVVLKLAQALWSRRHGGDPADLPPALDQLSDLVALATVADVVPLADENRTLVRRGLRRLAEADRPGLRALMSSAGVDPARVRASDLSFRLAPRINAAGRLGDPKLALDLLLAPSRAEAQPLAEQLEGRNRERQQVEDTILRAAAAEIERSGALERGDRILVAAGEGWHEGVIGIVASRLVERHCAPRRPDRPRRRARQGQRPLGLGLRPACRARGLQRPPRALRRPSRRRRPDASRRHPSSRSPPPCARTRPSTCPRRRASRSSVVDAVVAVGEVSLELARELARFEPCGYGNPGRQPARPGRAAHGHPGHGRGRQAPAPPGGRRLGALRGGGVGSRRRVRVAAHERASRRRLPPRGQRLARRARAAARAARDRAVARAGARRARACGEARRRLARGGGR